MAKSNMEMDLTFVCMICLEFPKEPINCRYCSKFVCTLCINTWFQTSENNGIFSCPNCRNSTQRSDFIKLIWFEDLLKSIKDQINEFQRTKMNECSQHAKQELCIYCSTCSKAICAQCILSMFNGEHIDHNHSRLDTAQQRLLKAIDEQEKSVKFDLNQLDICIQNKELFIDEILTRRNERLNELEQFQTNIKAQIELETKEDLEKHLSEQKVLIELMEEWGNYEKKYALLKKAIESSDKIELFDQEKKLFEQISQRPKVPTVDKVDLPADMFGSPLALPWQTGDFVIEQFSIKQKNNHSISSHQFQLDHNQSWTLIIYPNGKDPHTDVYLSVMLQLSKGMSQSIDYNIVIELIHHHYDDRRHNYALKSTQSFKEGQVNGCDQFYKLNNLSINGFIDAERDSIKIRFKLCPKSIFEERKLFQWQIESFKKTEQNIDEQNKEMKKIKDELINLQQNYREKKRIIEAQSIRIQELVRHNSELKRKRIRSNHDDRDEFINQEDHRSNSHETRTVIFSSEKRVRK